MKNTHVKSEPVFPNLSGSWQKPQFSSCRGFVKGDIDNRLIDWLCRQFALVSRVSWAWEPGKLTGCERNFA